MVKRNVLVVGNEGRMGRRYCNILEQFGCYVVGCEIGEDMEALIEKFGPDSAIVATPTPTHYDICTRLGDLDYLVEKPVSKKISDIELLYNCGPYSPDARVVCNWKYASPWTYDINNLIEYSNWMSGNDGLAWDCVQLLRLAGDVPIRISNDGGQFNCRINGHAVTLADIDASYVTMIRNWLYNQGDLWDMQDALEMTRKALEMTQPKED